MRTAPTHRRGPVRLLIALLLAGAVLSPIAQPASVPLRELAETVQAAEPRATIERLVGFGTRHTLSDTVSEVRGIGAARRWVQARFAAIGRECGGCLEVITPSQTFTGPRLPRPTEVVDLVAIQRGSDDPQRVLVITGHSTLAPATSWTRPATRPAPTTMRRAWQR